MENYEQLLRQISNENTARTFEYNAREAKRARIFQADMSNTSHQREVDDLKRAGLNPVLSSNGGAQAYSASSASASADTSAVSALANIYQTKLNNDNAARMAREQRLNDLRIAEINAATNKYVADRSYSASRYASDNSYASSVYASNTSAGNTRYSADRTKSGVAYNYLSGLTGHTARTAGKTSQGLLGKAITYVKNWWKNRK